MTQQRKFVVFAWSVFVYNLMVIAWGAYVRATGSGAGCGGHWPLCNGTVVPLAPQAETLIEYSHRISSGLTLVLVVILFLWAFRVFAKGHLARKAAGFALFFTITEALVGAGLVLFDLVADNTSATRAFYTMLHLTNTFLLLAALVLTARWSSGEAPERLVWPGWNGLILLLGLLGVLALGVSGAVTALGDTLFPVSSLAEGIQQDLSPGAHFLVRLRVLHPVIAVAAGVYLLAAVLWLRRMAGSREQIRVTTLLLALFAGQLALGALNVILLAPVWLQLVHLTVADLIWASLVLTAEAWFGGRAAPERLADERIEVGVESRPA